MTFADFGFDERIQRGVDEAGFKTPMPVQVQCFNLLVKENRDVYAQSQTGTGKTAAFFLSIFQLMASDEKYKDNRILIVVPTRELAVQIEEEGSRLGKYLDIRIGSIFGGMGYTKQERMLEKGVDVLIGTPGRIIDFSKKKTLNLSAFDFVVIDEADRLFDMGFLPDLRKIFAGMKPKEQRHTLLFSATMNSRVGNLAWEYMNNPGEVIIEPEKVTVDTVTQELYHIGKDEKVQLLLGVLKRDKPDNAVIFTNTRHAAWELAKRMEVNGYSVKSLMGDLPQRKRMRIIDDMKKGHHKFLVATDVAARGLHVDELEMVINYDVPLDAESYVHRIGRTARVGKKGKTITLACEEYVYGLSGIEALLGEKLPVIWADESLLVEDKSMKMSFPPRERYRDMDSQMKNSNSHQSRNSQRDRRKNAPESRGKSSNRHSSDANKRHSKNKQGDKRVPEVGGKKALDPRLSQIQSKISSVVGGLPDKQFTGVSKKKNSDNSKNKKPKQQSPQKRKKNIPDKKRHVDRAKPSTKTDKPISSKTTIDKRLEYYRKKYGDDFHFDESVSQSNKKQGKKTGFLKRLFGNN